MRSRKTLNHVSFKTIADRIKFTLIGFARGKTHFQTNIEPENEYTHS